MSTKPTLTEAEREQRRAQQRERLKQSAEQLLTSDGWRRWVQIRSRHGLSRLCVVIWGARCHRPHVIRRRAWTTYRRRRPVPTSRSTGVGECGTQP